MKALTASSKQVTKLAKTLKKMIGRPAGRNDLPRPVNSEGEAAAPNVDNTNTTVEREYRQEELTDPGIIDGVTASGGGPLLR